MRLLQINKNKADIGDLADINRLGTKSPDGNVTFPS